MRESRGTVITLSIVGAVLLVGIGGLHASAYAHVADSIRASQLSGFLKQVLPPLYLYPSVLMGVLAVTALAVLRFARALPFVMALLAVISLANTVLGFVLGGLLPGAVMLTVACIFALTSRVASAP